MMANRDDENGQKAFSRASRRSSARRISFPLNLSAGALAKACGLPRTRIERIAAETTGISADTALRLGKALGTSAQLWMNLQNRYDVEVAKREIRRKLDKIEPIIAHAVA